jgi:hypothetical protein
MWYDKKESCDRFLCPRVSDKLKIAEKLDCCHAQAVYISHDFVKSKINPYLDFLYCTHCFVAHGGTLNEKKNVRIVNFFVFHTGVRAAPRSERRLSQLQYDAGTARCCSVRGQLWQRPLSSSVTGGCGWGWRSRSGVVSFCRQAATHLFCLHRRGPLPLWVVAQLPPVLSPLVQGECGG